MNSHIRELTTLADFALAEAFQRDEWGMPVQSVVPDHVLLTAQKNGGIGSCWGHLPQIKLMPVMHRL